MSLIVLSEDDKKIDELSALEEERRKKMRTRTPVKRSFVDYDGEYIPGMKVYRNASGDYESFEVPVVRMRSFLGTNMDAIYQGIRGVRSSFPESGVSEGTPELDKFKLKFDRYKIDENDYISPSIYKHFFGRGVSYQGYHPRHAGWFYRFFNYDGETPEYEDQLSVNILLPTLFPEDYGYTQEQINNVSQIKELPPSEVPLEKTLRQIINTYV